MEEKQLSQDLNQTNESTVDKALSRGLRNIQDLEFKQEMDQALRKGPTKYSFSKWWRLGIAILIVLVGYMVYQWTHNSPKDPVLYATHYATHDYIIHPGSSKGIFSALSSSPAFSQAFNDQKWSEVIELAKDCGADDVACRFYLGMAHFYKKNFVLASNILGHDEVLASVYTEESRWYFALSLIGSDQWPLAKKVLLDISPTQWKYKEAQELLGN